MKERNIKPQQMTIIGAGKVGASLYKAFTRAGQAVQLVGKSKDEQLELTAHSDLILIAVQDGNIESVCKHIAPAAKPNTVIAHCSGALGKQPLMAAKQVDCIIGSAHPLNTFPTKDAAEQLLSQANHQTHCFISGDEGAKKALQAKFMSIGFKTAFLDDDAKLAYHTACVFLCNYLSSLAELGLRTAEQAGLERDVFWQAAQPLIQSTINNISKNGTAVALSGPIARGDATTVTKHLEGLQHAPELVQHAYKVLGQQAVELSASRNDTEDSALVTIKNALR